MADAIWFLILQQMQSRLYTNDDMTEEFIGTYRFCGLLTTSMRLECIVNIYRNASKRGDAGGNQLLHRLAKQRMGRMRTRTGLF